MYNMVEGAKRGGMVQATHRYAKANNKYLQPSRSEPVQAEGVASDSLSGLVPGAEESNLLMHLDANNLYGWAMSCQLPHKEFEWFPTENFTEDMVRNYDPNSDVGYYVECDLGYPKELHDAHSDYPLGPTRQCVTAEMLSPHCQKLYRHVYELGPNKKLPDEKVEKLLLTLEDKEKYTLHVQLLKFYLEQGLVLKQVHRVVRLKQSAWLEPYVRFNTDRRKLATSDFQKDFSNSWTMHHMGKP
jgi:hypothetical protein